MAASRLSEPTTRVDALLVLALAALAAAMSPLAALIIDSGRDLAAAFAIARGDEFPLYGPSLFGTWRPGPVWFYLLALPLAAARSVGAAAVFAGVLAAMKIPLAWSLGRRVRGPALGLAFAAFVALPGWTTLGQMLVSHTMLVEAGVLATLWLCLVAVQRGSALIAVLAAGLQALAVHAHPTALVAAPAVAWALWVVIARARRWGWLALAALAFVLPFLPALVAEAHAGWPQVAGSAGYFGAGDYLARLTRLDDVVLGATWGEAVFVRDFLLARWPWVAWFVFGGSMFAAVLAVAGACVGLLRDREVLAVLALVAGGWLFVLLLRDATPAWMVYGVLALDAGLLAFGWFWLWPVAWRLRAARALAVFALLASGALLASRVATVRDGTQYLPTASIADIAAPPVRDPPVRFWMPAYAHDRLAASACASTGDVSLHGDLATAMHFGQGVAAALHCGAAATLGFGGSSTRALAGVPRAVAGQLGITGEATAWGFVLATPVRVIHPQPFVPAATHTRYLVDDYLPRIGRAAPAVVRVRSACDADDVLVVTDRVPGLNTPFRVLAVDGELPPLLAQTIASRYFGCPASRGLALDVEALDGEAVGVVLLRAMPRG